MSTAHAYKQEPVSLLGDDYAQSTAEYDPELKAAIHYMAPAPRPCFTHALLDDIMLFQKRVERVVRRSFDDMESVDPASTPIEFVVFASAVPGVFNLGGDLDHFAKCIKEGDRGALLDYATLCIRASHRTAVSMELPLTTIALVEGSAVGGGFEGALSCNVIIAERGVEMGFPETLFNLFPGMGAYNFLVQRINPGLAERIILSGKRYPAEELYEMGVVDVLADRGKGKEALRDYVRSARQTTNARTLIRHTRRKYRAVSYEELLDITELWVKSALKLDDTALRTMRRLVRWQDARMSSRSLPTGSVMNECVA